MKKLAALLLLVSSLHAAERLTWDELSKRLNFTNHRCIKVTTRDGHKIHGRSLFVQHDGALISGRSVPSANIVRIDIRDRASNAYKIAECALAPIISIAIGCTGLDGALRGWTVLTCPAGIALAPPLLAVPAVATPIVLAEDAIALFHPARIYEVIPEPQP